MISALCWIPKGAAKAEPEMAELTQEDIEALKAEAEAGEGDDEEQVAQGDAG